MALDSTGLGDELTATTGYQRSPNDAGATEHAFVRGHGIAEVHGPDGELKERVAFSNLITQVGEQRYGEAGALASPTVAIPTGMQLGTGTTTPAKTGGGSSIGTLVSSSLVALSGTPTSSIPSSVRRLTYACTWAAGTATANGIAEVALVNQSIGTQTAAPASSTIARALLSPTVNKGASDALTITWHHDIGTA